jgi:hypothetical protein
LHWSFWELIESFRQNLLIVVPPAVIADLAEGLKEEGATAGKL